MGEQLADGWRLDERIGVDALARLFRARRRDGQTLTVRVIHDHLARNRTFLRGFAQAGSLAVKLRHPGILCVKSMGKALLQGRERLFVTSESFEGRNLCAIVQARGLLPVSQVLLITLEVLQALGGAHRHGSVHGDLLPESVIIGATEDGEVRAKVANFVLGRLAAVSVPRLFCGGTASGTCSYFAPEVVEGDEPSVPSDLYALGAILYEQLTGHHPFGGASCLVLAQHHLQRSPRPPREVAPHRGIGAATEAVVLRALEKDPNRRFSSAAEMMIALEEAKESDAVELASSSGFVTRARRLIGRTDIVDVLQNTALAPVVYGSGDRGHARGAVALLFGGAGMGKTAILREVLSRIEGGPVAVVKVQGRRALSRPLEPFTVVAGEALGLRRGSPKDRVERVQETLVSRFGVDPDEVVRLLDRVTGRASSLALTPDVLEREQVRALRSFIGRLVATRPTVLVIEDVDGMDPASLDLAKDLMEAAATLAMSLIVTGKSDPWPDWSARYVTRLQVGNLEQKAASAMLEGRLAGCDVPAGTKSLAVTWSKGSPLLLELCALAMRCQESLVDRDGNLAVPSTSQDLFGGLRHLVSIGWKGASPIVRRWLSCAALAGSFAPVELLEAFAPPQPNREAVLASCCETGLVRCEDDELVFENEGVRDVVRGLVPEGEERSIHRFIAVWLRDKEPPGAPPETIAGHLLAGGDSAAAAQVFEHDALDMLRREEPVVAASLLDRAQRVWEELGDDEGVCRVGLKRIEAFLAAGDGKAAAEVLSRVERFGPTGADGLRARVVASVASAQGNWDTALQALLRASDAAVDTLDQQAWFEVEFGLAELLFKRERYPEAEEHAAMALELSTALADSFEDRAGLAESSRIAQAASFLSRIRIATGRLREAREMLSLAIEHAAVREDPGASSRLLANLAYLCAETGDTEGSLSFAQGAFDLAHTAGDRMAAARIAINLGAYQMRLGRTEQALDSFSRAKRLARATGWARGVRLAKSAVARIRDGTV